MEITAKITGIEYKPVLISKLSEFNYNKSNFFNNFDVNKLPSCCMVNFDNFSFGLSKWVSPKRTRSYPYERVYNTLGCSKRITIIPVIKDEGKNGDRDFIQWDTISLMSLLDVYIVFTYYNDAEINYKKENKITKQKYCNELVKQKIDEIKNYHSSALHWNLKEIDESFDKLIEKVKQSYQILSNKLNIDFHNESGIDNYYEQFHKGVEEFKSFSRRKAKGAQNRESLTIQPKEALSTLSKATITIKNYLGGIYYFTVDEIKIVNDNIFLIETKHSNRSLIPSARDIKDGLLKMILFTNLKDIKILTKKYKSTPILKLTSSKLTKGITSNNSDVVFQKFKKDNNLTYKQGVLINNLLEEARYNSFKLIIENY
ncbi:MAG: hypothetical protein N2319_08060 [Candidatus Kapabacteria bacterium]|nr:hypothetical protein [Candidatus Kapabacteria bacterium]